MTCCGAIYHLVAPKIDKMQQDPQDTCSKNPGRVFSEGAEPPEAGHHQSHSSGGTSKPVKMSMISQDMSTFFKNVDFSKSQTLNVEKCMIHSRNIEVFKCHYAHFAHIRLSFGCTDEKIDVCIYLHTFGNCLKFPNLEMWKLKSCNVPGNVFRISKSPDVGGNRKPEK